MDRKDFLKKSAGVVLGASMLGAGLKCSSSTEPKQIPQLGLNFDELPKSIKATVDSNGKLTLSMAGAKKLPIEERNRYRKIFKDKNVPQSEKDRLIEELRANGLSLEQKKQFLKDVRELAKNYNERDNEEGDWLNITQNDCVSCSACVSECPESYIIDEYCNSEQPIIKTSICYCGFNWCDCYNYQCVLQCPTHSFNFTAIGDICEN